MRWKTLLCFAALATVSHAIQNPVISVRYRNSQVAVNHPSELNQATHANSQNHEDETTEKSTYYEAETEKSILTSSAEQNSNTDSSNVSNGSDRAEGVPENPISLDNDENNSESQHLTSSEKISSNSEDITPSNELNSSPEEDIESKSGSSAISRSDEGSNDNTILDSGIVYEDDGYITTSYGPVKGSLWAESEDIIAYIDIPYGSFIRFEPPSAPETWQAVHEVTEHNKRCPQLIEDVYVGDLDCLTLSIFAPIDARNASVLFHIYDSKFSTGSADPTIYSPQHLVSKGIILVLPNYRVGPLGFLCLQNETAIGNAGLKDLTLALSWVHNNIGAFGGNPDNIVVSGDGTSGALVGYLSLSSNSSKYIKKAITESGSVLSHWALDRDPSDTASQFLDKLREHGSFESVDISTIYTVSKNISFRPSLGLSSEALIEDTPWSMIRDNIINITFMIGSANYAGTNEALDLSMSNINENFEILLPNDLRFETSEIEREIAARVRAEYFGDVNITLEKVNELSIYFTDASYLAPSIRSARLLVESGATVFLYEFGFVGALNRELIALGNPVEGAVLGDLAGYIFALDEVTLAEGTDEKRVMDLLLDLWVSFINTGRPTTDAITWNELKLGEDSEEPWLSIENTTSLENGLHVTRMKLWTEIYNCYFIERSDASTHKFSITLLVILNLCLICTKK